MDGEEKSMSASRGTTIVSLLQKLGINRETVLVRKNGSISVEEEEMKEGDTVEIIKAISGG